MARTKPRYRTAVAERYLDAARGDVWATVLAALGGPTDLDDAAAVTTRSILVAGTVEHQVTQTVISLDRGWRLVLDVADGPVPFHQEALVLMPRPAVHAARLGASGVDTGCIAMLSVLVGPDDAADTDYAIAVTATVQTRLDHLLAGGGRDAETN